MYCCETDDKKAIKICKGMDRTIVKHRLLVDGYLYTWSNNKKSHYTSNKICSKSHQAFSITINKIGLSSYDNKRYYIDNITSLPYGHYNLRSQASSINKISCLRYSF